MPLEKYIEKPRESDKDYKAALADYATNRQSHGAATRGALAEFNRPLGAGAGGTKEQKEYISAQKTNIKTFVANCPQVLEAYHRSLSSESKSASADPEDDKALAATHAAVMGMFAAAKDILKIEGAKIAGQFDSIKISGEKSLAYVRHLIVGLNIITGYPANGLLGAGMSGVLDDTIIKKASRQIAEKMHALCLKVDAYYIAKYGDVSECSTLKAVLEQEGAHAAGIVISAADYKSKEQYDNGPVASQLASIEANCANGDAEIAALAKRIAELTILEQNTSLQLQTAIGSYRPPIRELKASLAENMQALIKQVAELRTHLSIAQESVASAATKWTSGEAKVATPPAATISTSAQPTTDPKPPAGSESKQQPVGEVKVMAETKARRTQKVSRAILRDERNLTAAIKEQTQTLLGPGNNLAIKTPTLAGLTAAIEKLRTVQKELGTPEYKTDAMINTKAIAVMNAEMKTLLDTIGEPDFGAAGHAAILQAFTETSQRCQQQCAVLGVNFKEQITQPPAEVNSMLVIVVAKDLLEHAITGQQDSKALARHIEKKYTSNGEFKTQCTALSISPEQLISDAQALNQTPERAALMASGKEILLRAQNEKFVSNPGYRQQTIKKLEKFEKQCPVHNIDVHELGVGIRKHAEILNDKDTKATATARATTHTAESKKSSGPCWIRRHFERGNQSTAAAKSAKSEVAHEAEAPKP